MDSIDFMEIYDVVPKKMSSSLFWPLSVKACDILVSNGERSVSESAKGNPTLRSVVTDREPVCDTQTHDSSTVNGSGCVYTLTITQIYKCSVS